MAEDFVAGCLGGCVGVLVGHPFDTIKVRLQTQDSKNPQYKGTFHCMRTIIRNESVQGLFKGMSSPMASLSVINAIVFGVYGNMQKMLMSPEEVSGPLTSRAVMGQLLCGAAAGAVQSLVSSPTELLKIRMQIQEGAGKLVYTGPMDCLVKVRRKEGLRGIYRGFGITVLRDAPGFGAYFASYEVLTRQVFGDDQGRISTPGLLMSGGLAGILSWIACYPIDVVKSRLQADGFQPGGRMYKGAWDCTVQSFRSEGLGVFFKGFNTTIIRAFPVNAATFAVVHYSLRFLDSREEELQRRPNINIIHDKDPVVMDSCI